MKKKDFTELKNKKIEYLKKIVQEKKDLAEKKRIEKYSGKEKNLKIASNMRREIAQILTLIREKEIVEKMGSSATNKQ